MKGLRSGDEMTAWRGDRPVTVAHCLRGAGGVRHQDATAAGRRLRALVLLALGTFAVAPTQARAGDYSIDFCKVLETDRPAASLPVSHSFDGLTNDCHRGGPDGGLHALMAGGMMPFATTLAIGVAIPPDRPGLTIKRATTAYGAPANIGSLAFPGFLAAGQLLALDTAPVTRVESFATPPGTRDLAWNLFCSTSGSTNCYFPTPTVLHVYKARLQLTDSVDPSVTATGGSLLGGGPRAGPRTLMLDAVDRDSGMSRLWVKLGGTLVADLPYDCAFDDWSACRRDRYGQIIDVDTTKVSDGVRALSVFAADASGNQTRTELGDVTIANAPPPLPRRDPTPAPPPPPAPVGSSGASVSVVRVRALIRLQRSRLTVANGARALIRGRLVDDDDRPIADATIHVDERVYIPKTGLIGPSWTRLGHVATDGTGAFSAEIPAGSSRALRFSYEPAGVADAAEARISVRSGVVMRVSRRVVRNGSAISFTGRVAGVLPRAGVLVTLQAYVPGRGWVPADSRPKLGRAGSDGRFRVSYRFRNTLRRSRYLFRMLVNEDSAFAYTGAASRPVGVTVLPSRRPRR